MPRRAHVPRWAARPQGLHLHFHGVSAENVAAILRDGHGVNPGSGPRVTPAWPKRE